MFKIDQRKGCKNAERTIVASVEISNRCNKYDPRIGVCLANYEDENGKVYWNTWEYNAEDPCNYNTGHYYMTDELSAWNDYFVRCCDLVDFIKRYTF